MKTIQEQEADFLRDIAQHQMTVIRDDGVNRHIMFKRPNSGTYWLELLTWPGALCINGDCGTYVFMRLRDMFEFFRTDRHQSKPAGRVLHINQGYWAEKCTSASIFGSGIKEYSPEKFEAAVKDDFDQYFDGPDEDKKKLVWESVEDEVLNRAHDGHYAAVQAAMDFEHGDFRFHDFYERRLEEYTHHFTWNCFAIAWGIQQYDQLTQKAAA